MSFLVTFSPICRIFDQHIKPYVKNEAQLLMASSLITPLFNALNVAESGKVIEVS